MEHGRIVESGSPAGLLRQNGVFARMVHLASGVMR